MSERKRGPRPQSWVALRTSVTPEIDRAITEIVQATGVSKASVVRRLLARGLADHGAISPEVTASLPPTPTAGRLAAVRNMKEHNP